jgi:hypothetical protein
LKNFSPIALFVYNRPWHVRETIAALQGNGLATESDLYVFSDAAKDRRCVAAVQAVRDYIRTIGGFKSVTIVERTRNLGLAQSVIDGVTMLCSKYGRVVVLEDDMITSAYFLRYMNAALDKYAMDDRVISVHGYLYPVSQQLPEAFFLRGADCWGWATWSRGWALFNPDGSFLLNELHRRGLVDEFDFNGSNRYSEMMQAQINGENDSWAVRWYASAFLAEKLTLHPGRSLILNIGNDSSGTHHGNSDTFDVQLSNRPIDINDLEVVSSVAARAAFESFFRRSGHGKLGQRVIKFVKHIVKRTVGTHL